MNISTQISNNMLALAQEAIQKVLSIQNEEVITDFHIQTNSDTGEVRICDDNDDILATTNVEGCEEMNNDEFRHLIGKSLRQELERLNQEKAFDQLDIFRPFSFVLEDEDKETIEDLLVVDNETIMLSEELLNGLDQELDDFIGKLMAD